MPEGNGRLGKEDEAIIALFPPGRRKKVRQCFAKLQRLAGDMSASAEEAARRAEEVEGYGVID